MKYPFRPSLSRARGTVSRAVLEKLCQCTREREQIFKQAGVTRGIKGERVVSLIIHGSTINAGK